jgi:hypothetical protein
MGDRITPKREEGVATMSAGEAELQEPRITFLATLPEVMRHIERLRIKNIIPGVVKRIHDWLDKDSSGNHVFTDLETNGEETLLFACAAFRGLIVDFGLLVDMNCLINEEDFHGLCGLSERYAQAIAEHHAGGICDCCKERMHREGPAQ